MTPQVLLEIAGLPATEEAIASLTEAAKSSPVKEGIEDKQGALQDQFDDAIKTVADKAVARRLRSNFNAGNRAFSRGYENDDDNKMDGGLDEMENAVKQAKNTVDHLLRKQLTQPVN